MDGIIVIVGLIVGINDKDGNPNRIQGNQAHVPVLLVVVGSTVLIDVDVVLAWLEARPRNLTQEAVVVLDEDDGLGVVRNMGNAYVRVLVRMDKALLRGVVVLRRLVALLADVAQTIHEAIKVA